MTPEKLVDRIRAEVIDRCMASYRELFANTAIADATDPYWKRALTLHVGMTDERRTVLFEIMRQVMVDTTSNFFGLLDGVRWLDGQTEDFKLTMESGTEKLNEDLDLFLAKEENDPQVQ